MRISATCKGKRKPKQTFIVRVNNDTQEEYNSLSALCSAHPSQNRLTWRYRLYAIKKPRRSYFEWEENNLLEIIPTSQEYIQRVEQFNTNVELNKKGEQQ